MHRLMCASLIAVLLLTGACATNDDWAMWRSHTTHFASGEHGLFSLRNNKDGSNPRVSRADIDNTREQNWWGLYAVNVNRNQIYQN